MKYLIVEDEDPKQDKIMNFMKDNYPEFVASRARSVRSAIETLSKETPDLLLLDMSLPTFDVSSSERGGHPQGFGGIEVIRHLEQNGIRCPTIVITGYDAFIDEYSQGISLEEMDQKLSEEYTEGYQGLVYYNALYEKWEQDLATLLEKTISN